MNGSYSAWIRRSIMLGSAGLVALFVGCQTTPYYVINQPADQGTVVCSDATGMNCDVQVDIQWSGVSVRPAPDLALDGSPLPIQLTSQAKSVVGRFTTGVGAHTLQASGDLSGKGGLHTYSATNNFTVVPQPPPTGGFGLSAPSQGVVLERGGTATVTITVTRSAPFTGEVELALPTPPAGITAAATKILAGQSSAPLTIMASAAAAFGKPTLVIKGTAQNVQPAQTGVKLIIGRQPGAFNEANPTPYSSTVPSSKTSLTGGFRVDLATGAPSLPTPRKATFFRGTAMVGNEIGFTLGPVSNLGGAGFCANSSNLALTRGVVLSGALPGYPSQNVFTILDLTIANPPLVSRPADMQVQPATGPLYVFAPRIFFSPDCTLALIAGANKLGPSRNTLQVIDLLTGNNVGSEVPFETNVFGALLRSLPTKQEIVITVDTGSPTAATTVYTVP